MASNLWTWGVNPQTHEEDFIRCEICQERFRRADEQTGEVDSHPTIDAVMRHLTVAHKAFEEERILWTVLDFRETDIIGYEYSSASRDCDGPMEHYGTRRLPEGVNWLEFLGRQAHWVGSHNTNCEEYDREYEKQEFVPSHDGLVVYVGGATDEGYSGCTYIAIFAHEDYKLEEDDRQRDVYAEQMGY